MNIKEVEKLLLISRYNIRFYENIDLTKIKHQRNNYREYSEENVRELKKIIVFRKLGFSIDEIKQLQDGEVELVDVASDNIIRLENEVEILAGALDITRSFVKDNKSFRDIDENYYWDIVKEEESKGNKFTDISEDYLTSVKEYYHKAWKKTIFRDFKKTRKEHGLIVAICILLGLCLVRGLFQRFLWQGSFWDGFLSPFMTLLLAMVIIIPIHILLKKAPKVGVIVVGALLALCLAILAGVVILLIVCILNHFFHFWF